MTTQRRSDQAVYRLLGAAFIADFCIAMVGLAVQNYGIQELKAPNFVLGLFATLPSVAYSIGCLFSGTLSDRWGRRRCIVIACVLSAVAWVLVPRVGPWRHIVAVLPLSGIGMSLFWPSLQAWIAEHSTGSEGLNRNLGRFNILWSIGLMLGPLATGYLWVVSHDLTFVLPSALVLLLIPVALLTPRGDRPAAAAEGAPSEEDGPHPEADLFLRLAWIGNFAAFFIGGIILAMFPKLGWEMQYSEPNVGWLLFGYRLAQVLMFIYTSSESRWQYRLWPLLAAEGMAAAGMVLAALARTPALFAIGFAAAGACAGVTYVASLFYSLHGREGGRGRSSGFHEAVLGSGGFLGPLLAGIAAQFIDIQYTFLLAAGMMVISVGLQVKLYRSGRRTVEQSLCR